MTNYSYNGFKNLETQLIVTMMDTDANYWQEEVKQLRAKGFTELNELGQELKKQLHNRSEGFKRITDLSTDSQLLIALSDELNLHDDPPETPKSWLREMLLILCLQGVDWEEVVLHYISKDNVIEN